MKKNTIVKYNGIDIIKFIMSICVVAIHTEPIINCNNSIIQALYQSIVRMAVPFFFIASGFFIGKKMNYPYHNKSDLNVIWKYTKRMINLYLLWSLIYLPLAIIFYVDIKYTVLQSVISYIKYFFLIGEHYNSWMLWYLLSTIYSLIFIYFLLKKKISPYVTVIVCGLITIIGMLITDMTTYSGDLPQFINLFIKLIIKTISDGRIFTGFFYIALGLLFAHKELSNKVGTLLFVLGFIGTFAGSFVPVNTIFNLSLMVCVSGLFCLTVKWKGGNTKVCSKLRTMSTVIYFVHMYIWTFYYTIVYNGKTRGFDSFVVTTIISILLGCIYLKLIQIKKDKKKKLILCNVSAE